VPVRTVWNRTFDGGGIGIWRLREREARIEIRAFPLARYQHMRHAMRGSLGSAWEMLGVRTFVQILPNLTTDETLAYRVVWSPGRPT
jgi:hypothetical protein